MTNTFERGLDIYTCSDLLSFISLFLEANHPSSLNEHVQHASSDSTHLQALPTPPNPQRRPPLPPHRHGAPHPLPQRRRPRSPPHGRRVLPPTRLRPGHAAHRRRMPGLSALRRLPPRPRHLHARADSALARDHRRRARRGLRHRVPTVGARPRRRPGDAGRGRVRLLPLSDAGPAVPREMTEAEIWACVEDFKMAARNAVEGAGFDGVEIHGANGYLVDQFLQDTCNKRTDAWGGSVQRRAQFALEVAKAVVEAVGPEKVGFRLSPWSTFQGMRMANPIPQFTYVVQTLREMGLGYLHLVESRVVNSVDVEKAGGLEFALEAWGKKQPVLVAGGFKPDSARKAVDDEYQDWNTVVVFGRFFLSTPDLVYRLEKGIEPNPYDRSTFYTPMQEKGYLDYPFSEELKQKGKVKL
ncbi:hypothetical protein C8Q74DRAFT_175476 [Fomes fomentarius]|nr:hypothetical protein C8Q74DRAFT_175476 [Fomes fomentarius]